MTKIGAFLTVAGLAAAAGADTVAKDDLDGNTIGLLGRNITNLDGGGGDWFGVASRNGWPQATGVPFSLADDSVVDYSGGGIFPSDNEGIYGMNSDFDNDYFALSDTREWTADQLQADWTFDVSGASNLGLSIDIGGISSASSGGYSADTFINFYYSFDGGAETLAFAVTAEDNVGQFTTRPMDSAGASGGGRLLRVDGPNGVTKFLAEDGSAAGNTYVDKSVVSGLGAGEIDSFFTSLTGVGSQLKIRMEANVPFEAAAFDNICITPAPAGVALLGLSGLVATRRRR
ncbi:MAG: hypothetical protein H6811_09170 [Phycisphaeraceae bacterium]|nr:hypothetical protein [Phycisphaeraceae bacterium]